MTIVTLYHGTDIESALDILNNGLSQEKLLDRQGKYLQSGVGWYTAIEPNVAWFFATLAAEAFESCTVIEMQISEETLDSLLTSKQARRELIGNVPFDGEQIWFALETLDILNKGDYSGTLLPGRGNGHLVRQNSLRLFLEGIRLNRYE